MIKLVDIIQVEPQESFTKLSKREKHQLIDSVLQAPSMDSQRGLKVNFNLSSSGRRINNRIYTPAGQRAGLSTWTDPFPKPIIRNHDRSEDPIGRFISVDWVSNEQAALGFFDNVNDYMALQDAFASDRPRKIYKALKKFGLLTNRKWPGLGALYASAKILDEDAIEKFMDGRYMTFSAGSHTDRYACGLCGDDWAQGEICDHRPGKITEDGDMGIFITGIFEGDEGSVLTMPANDFSQVESMEFVDNLEFGKLVSIDSRLTDTSTIYITDALISIGENTMPTKEEPVEAAVKVEDAKQRLLKLDPRDVARGLIDGTLEQELVDALEGSSHFEIKWLIKIHDALHYGYDFQVRHVGEEDELSIPTAVFKFHGDLHELSTSKDFRDSLLNGPLDGFDSAGTKSEEYMVKASEDSVEEPTELETKLEDATETVEEKVEDGVQETEVADQTATQEAQVQEEVTDSDCGDECELGDLDLDWATLDLALEAEVLRLAEEEGLTDAKLSTEKRKSLKASQFCGPERSFPVPDCAHVTAARRLIGRAKLTADQKKRVLACVDRKAKSMSCDSEKDSACNCENVQKDYAEALKMVDSLKVELETLKQKLEDKDTACDTIQPETQEDKKEIKPIENPSVDSSDVKVESFSSKDSEVGGYLQKVTSKYNDILTKDGAFEAEAYLLGQKRRGYIPRNFDPNK